MKMKKKTINNIEKDNSRLKNGIVCTESVRVTKSII